MDYPNRLYEGVPQFVPATYDDDLSDWDRSKNPAFEYCDARCWLAERDGVLGHWSQLVPAYPRLCREDGSTALLWTAHQPSFRGFHAAYLADCARYPAQGDLLTRKGPPPENSYVISCIPCFSFDTDFK